VWCPYEGFEGLESSREEEGDTPFVE
jgi:hypothetical protein